MKKVFVFLNLFFDKFGVRQESNDALVMRWKVGKTFSSK